MQKLLYTEARKKKLAVVFLGTVLAVSAVMPAFSATNPFMDVPMNHWAYDAIGQLAAHGILSGYPDGTYKGSQQTTRYEMASALARALAVVDMTKASKQDVEMLKHLVVEFKDELEALGVRVDEIDERVSVMENRLGGWHVHGTVVLDIMNRSANNAADKDGDGSVAYDEARLYFERTWGEDDQYFFKTRIRNEGDSSSGRAGLDKNSAYMDMFYAEVPFFFDSRLTIGRFIWNPETAYYLGGDSAMPATGGFANDGDAVLTDRQINGLGITKNFGLGVFRAYFAHPNAGIDGFPAYDAAKSPHGINANNWEFFAEGSFQFNEQLGFDLGGHAFIGDNAETPGIREEGSLSFNNLWTIFAGLRFNFNDNIALKGVFYHQEADAERVSSNSWTDYGYGILDGNEMIDEANHWAVIVDVKQEALKYTSMWLEYGQYDAGFFAPQGMNTIFPSESKVLEDFVGGGSQVQSDLKYWRAALGQQWSEKWATHLFYFGYKYEMSNGDSVNPVEFGAGVEYRLNDFTTMGLNYVHVDNDREGNDTEDNILRFRTAVSF